MFLFVVTSFQGWLMIFQDGHAVGAPNDSPGLPLLNWSLTGGDLRVSHFIGLHALQVLPITGYYASRWTGGSSRRALGAVGIVSTLYASFVGLTFVQALRGTPFVGTSTIPELPPSAIAAGLLLSLAGGIAVFALFWRR
ncbi:MAG: hypothetical protein ABEH88_11515, partial [Halobacteriales archaeon]